MLHSMEAFFMALPLIEERDLADFFHRVTGEFRGTYLSDKLADLWEAIPESPSKIYVHNYCYFHMQSPTIDECEDMDTEEAKEKVALYHRYQTSRRCHEEQAAYLAMLNAYRVTLHNNS